MTDVRLPEPDRGGGHGSLPASITPRPASETVELTARIAPDGFDGAPVEARDQRDRAASGLTEVVLKPQAHPELMLHQPRLWWPVTYGDQPLYRLTVEARVDGQLSSRVTRRFGVRSVGTKVLPSGGRAFTVNGRTIRMTGGAWVPDFLMSWSAQRYRDEVAADGRRATTRSCASTAAASCRRTPFSTPATATACWSGRTFRAPRCSSGQPVYGEVARTGRTCRRSRQSARCDPTTYLDNMKDCIFRLRGRPSLLLWCGSNEAAPQADVGKALQNEILPALDGTRPWLPDSHESPPWRKEDLHTSFRRALLAPFGCPTTSILRPRPEVRLQERDRPVFAAADQLHRQGDPRPRPAAIGIVPLEPRLGLSRCIERVCTIGRRDHSRRPWRAGLSGRVSVDGRPLQQPLLPGDLRGGQQGPAPQCRHPRLEDQRRLAQRGVAGVRLAPASATAGYYGMRSACRPLHVQHAVDDWTVQVVSTLAEPRPNLKVRTTLTDAAGRIEQTQERIVIAAADATTRGRPAAGDRQERQVAFSGAGSARSAGPRVGSRGDWGAGRLPLPRTDAIAARSG